MTTLNDTTGRGSETSPVELWFGLFLVLYSAPFLLNFLYITDYPGWQMQSQSGLLGLVGVGLFLSGGFVMTRGIAYRRSHLALAATAVLLGLADIYPRIVYGNPFSGTPGPTEGLVVAVGLLGSLTLAAAAVWLFGTVLGKPQAGSGFERATLLFVAAFALQKGVVPLVVILIDLVADLARIGTALFIRSGLSWASYVLPPLVRAVAGVTALWVIRTTLKTGEAAPAADASGGLPARVPIGPSALAVALWAVSDLLMLGSLWSSWLTGLAAPPPLALRLQTSLLLVLPALALFALSAVLVRQGHREAP